MPPAGLPWPPQRKAENDVSPETTELLLKVCFVLTNAVVPELLGRLGVPQAQAEDAFSAGYLLGLLSLGQLEVGRANREATAQSKRLATLSMNSELRFESAEQRARFTAELQRGIVELTARHASPFTREDGIAGAGRPYRLILGCYPIPPKPSEEDDSGGKP